MNQPKVENRRTGNDIAVIVIAWLVLSVHVVGYFNKFAIGNWHELYRSDWKTIIGVLSSRPLDFCLDIKLSLRPQLLIKYEFG